MAVAGFVFNDAQSTALSTVKLALGQASKPLVLRVAAPNPARVHSSFVVSEAGVLSTEGTASYDAQDPYRTFELVGAKAGRWTVLALAIPRVGDSVELARLTVEVTAVGKDDPDLMYRGTYLVWQKSVPAHLGKDPVLFRATSGLTGHQIAREQANKDHGPLPEGRFSLVARMDPQQATGADALARDRIPHRDGTLAIANLDEGIQVLPVGGAGPVYPNWGTMRVRLTPVAGDMHGRGGFYLHNSHKGFSHGCIEVGTALDTTDFFSTVAAYAVRPGGGPARLTLGISYGHPLQGTRGDTLRP